MRTVPDLLVTLGGLGELAMMIQAQLRDKVICLVNVVQFSR